MKFSKVTAAALLSAAIVSATNSLAADFKWIKSEAEFNNLVVGKKLRHNKNYVTIKSNGELLGNFGGKALKGTWKWKGNYWCRTLTTHSKNTDCQKWETDGTTFKVARKKGNGKAFTYTVK